MSNEMRDWRRIEKELDEAQKTLCMERYIEYTPRPIVGYCKLPKGHEGDHEFKRVYEWDY